MKKSLLVFLSLFTVVAMLAACAPTPTPAPEEPAPAEEPAEAAFRVGYVTDTGGIDDQSFNTNQWEGISGRRRNSVSRRSSSSQTRPPSTRPT